MGHTHINTSEVMRYGNHHKGQDKEITNPISLCILFQPDSKNFLEGDKYWKLPQWTGLNNKKLLEHLPPSIATAIGHLDQ